MIAFNRLLRLIGFAFTPHMALAASDSPLPELSIGGVSIGATETQVVSVFGEPASRPQVTEEERGLYEIKFAYRDATAFFTDGRLLYLESSRSAVCTPSGICPGTDAAVARSKIGCDQGGSEATAVEISCFDVSSACSVVVSLQDGKATTLRLECLP